MRLPAVPVGLVLLLARFALAAPASRPAPRPPTPVDPTTWRDQFDQDRDGFTVFPDSADTRVVYLSSAGDDANDGASPQHPILSLSRAFGGRGKVALLRPGHPDRLLLRAGDSFDARSIDAPVSFGGKGPGEPLLIGRYGTGARPVLRNVTLTIGGRAGAPRFLVVTDLDLQFDARDPASPAYDPAAPDAYGINVYGDNLRYLWVEDCRVRFAYTGVCVQVGGGSQHLVLRRNVVADCYASTGRAPGHSQGLYLQGVNGALLEENVFDHDGWNAELAGAVPAARRDVFEHDVYLQHGPGCAGMVVRDNVIARAASHGVQLRPGGQLVDNLFLRNPLAGFVSDAPSVVRGNVVLDADDIGPAAPRGTGLEVLDCPDARVEGNILAHKRATTNASSPAIGVNPTTQPSRVHVTMADNIVYRWPGGVQVRWPGETRVETSGNATDAAGYADPERDAASYAASIGLADASVEGFLAAARDNCRGNWNAALTAKAVNAYIRAGFAPAAPATTAP